MFAGSHLLTVDDKGRLAIPARFRAQLLEKYGPQVYITRSYQACVEIYPASEFRAVVEQIDQMADRRKADLATRAFIGHAEETEIDRQGRSRTSTATATPSRSARTSASRSGPRRSGPTSSPPATTSWPTRSRS
jgi:division/cell wall cluster transcriptional repressor MraZ